MASAVNEVETYFGRCRCCLNYGYLKNMWEEHIFNGKKEIYVQMLVQCFALSWDSEAAVEQDQICDTCIKRLRDASEFKQMVLDSQDELLTQLGEEFEVPVKVKQEIDYTVSYKGTADSASPTGEMYIDDPDDPDYVAQEDPDYVDQDDPDVDQDDASDMQYEEVEYLDDEDNKAAILALESQKPERRTKTARPNYEGKWPKKLPKSERYKTYKQYTEEDLRNCLEEVRSEKLTPLEASAKYNIPRKTICAKVKQGPSDDRWQSSERTPETPTDRKVSTHVRNQEVLYKFKENVRHILENSNATPIKGHWGIGYGCSYCAYQNAYPSELKKHCLETHFDIMAVLKAKNQTDLTIKLDITGLQCKLCGEKFDDSLAYFMQHLFLFHDKEMHFDINDYIVPYKFDSEELRCAVCSRQFDNFKNLAEHMNEHYRNYDCDTCGRGFINKRSLMTHMNRHQTGVFPCSYCSKVFDTRVKMRGHERNLHMKKSKTRKCAYCDEMFMDTVRKIHHEVTIHGAPLPSFECKACGKKFESQRSLKAHVNQYHLLLRPHTCGECGKGFYFRSELKRHVVRHTGLRNFQCDTCQKLFSSRHSLTSHLQRHEKEQSFTCEFCEKKFGHKWNRMRHMKKKHGEEIYEVIMEREKSENVGERQFSDSDSDKSLNPEKTINKEKMFQLIQELKTILTYTNATPFKSKANRYYCAYCTGASTHYDDADELRTHTRTKHVIDRTQKIEYAMRPHWMNETIKLDIENLLCVVCCLPISTWNDMFKHLKEQHKIILDQAYTRAIPYLLKSEIKCALCKEPFSNFMLIDGHMNAHYNNYVCDDCGDTFLSANRLKQHMKIHAIGKFPCSICPKVFSLDKYKKKHEELVHKHTSKFKCWYCDERFSGEYLRHVHIVERHHEKVKIITCEFCGKTFTWRPYYVTHKRKSHIADSKKFECQECGKKFLLQFQYKEHLLRHTGEKHFPCEICGKKYVSSGSLKHHRNWHKKQGFLVVKQVMVGSETSNAGGNLSGGVVGNDGAVGDGVVASDGMVVASDGTVVAGFGMVAESDEVVDGSDMAVVSDGVSRDEEMAVIIKVDSSEEVPVNQ